MIVWLPFLIAAGVGFALWTAARPVYEAPVLQRTNYRGHAVPVAAGVVLVAAAITVEAGWRIMEVAGWIDHLTADGFASRSSRTATLIAALGFGLLGAFDDVAAHGDIRGFKGHLTNMARGRLTTGGLKLSVGGILAIIAVAGADVSGAGELFLGAVLVALAANLGNLFDRAPGRTTKVSLLAGVVLVCVTPTGEWPLLTGVVVVLGAGAGLIVPDLREQLMLGDAGANVLGAALGLGVVMTTGTVAQAVVLTVLLALNLVSERVSFSRVIDGLAPLRALDRAGRRPS